MKLDLSREAREQLEVAADVIYEQQDFLIEMKDEALHKQRHEEVDELRTDIRNLTQLLAMLKEL